MPGSNLFHLSLPLREAFSTLPSSLQQKGRQVRRALKRLNVPGEQPDTQLEMIPKPLRELHGPEFGFLSPAINPQTQSVANEQFEQLAPHVIA